MSITESTVIVKSAGRRNTPNVHHHVCTNRFVSEQYDKHYHVGMYQFQD